MINEIKIGTFTGTKNSGSTVVARAGASGETITADAHGRYQEPVLQGNTYYLSVAAGGATAYVGAAGGSPLLAIHNPIASGKNLILLGASIANRVASSAAGTVSMGIWGGPSVLPTGTATNPTSLFSLASTGSAARGFVNTALTGSTALSLILSPWTYYWATAAGAIMSPGYFDIAGLIVVVPGNQIAIGATFALTSATWDVSLIWEEVAA